MAQLCRREVLLIYKKLHRTSQKVFEGDNRALVAARIKINAEFNKNKHVSNPESVTQLFNLAKEVENELRCSVIQAQEVEPGKFVARITEDTKKFDNVPYKTCTNS